MRDRPSLPVLALVAFFAIVVAALQLGLPAETFVAGDSGVKLVAARNALAFPASPLEIPLPRVGAGGVTFVEPFYRVHDGHRHAVTPELFPILTAPLLAGFERRGVYVLPALGFLLALVCWAWVARLLDAGRSVPLVMLTCAFGTPWLFYGLEFWEHAPAVGVAGFGMALLLRASGRGSDPAPAFGAGLVLGLATLLRPEAACFVVALAVAGLWTGHLRWSIVGWAAGAAVATWLPIEFYAVRHFGALSTPHVSGTSAVFEGNWAAERARLITTWLVVPSTSNLWRVAPVLLLAPFALLDPARNRTFLAIASVVTIGLVVLIAPNDGGAEWGPRYLLVACGPLAILAADVLRFIARRGRLGAVVVTGVLLAGAWVQRDGYHDLRVAKEIYARMLAFVRDTTPPGGYVVTDLWWLDQVAASAGDRTFLYAGDPPDTARLVVTLDEARVPRFTAIVSRDEPHSWLTAALLPCYQPGAQRTLPDRSLVAIGFLRSCE